MEDGFDVVILPLVVGEVLLGVGLPLLGQGLLLLQGKRLLLVSGKPLGVNLLLSLLLLALQLGLLLLLQEGVPLGGHHRVGVDGGPGGIHIQGFPLPHPSGKDHKPGDALAVFRLKGIVAGGKGEELIVGAHIHLGVDDGALPDFVDILRHVFIAFLINEVVVEEVRVVLLADHHAEDFVHPLVVDAVVAYQGVGAVVFDGLVVQQLAEHLAVVHVVGIDNGVVAGLPLKHPVVHKGHAVVVVLAGEVQTLVISVIGGLHHHHVQILGAVNFNPPGHVVVLGVQGGEFIQVAAGVAVHILRTDIRVAVGIFLVLDQPFVFVGFPKDAGNIDDAAHKNHHRKAQYPQTEAVLAGELFIADFLN